MKSKRVHISVKAILVLLIILCASSAGINFYLHKNYKEAFAKDESYIEDGAQKIGEGVYGKSITDPCLGWEKSEKLIYTIADQL